MPKKRLHQNNKVSNPPGVERYIVVSCVGGYGMHTPTHRINNLSRGRWRDRSVGSGGCTRSGFGNLRGAVRWLRWEDFNIPRGKMMIGDAYAEPSVTPAPSNSTIQDGDNEVKTAKVDNMLHP